MHTIFRNNHAIINNLYYIRTCAMLKYAKFQLRGMPDNHDIIDRYNQLFKKCNH